MNEEHNSVQENIQIMQSTEDLTALQRENAQLKEEYERFLHGLQSFYAHFPFVKDQKMVSIRNFPSAVADDPMQVAIALLERLSIPVEEHQIRVVSCNELVCNKPLHQILLEFHEFPMKIQLIANFPQLANDESEMLRILELRDTQDTRALYKQTLPVLRPMKKKNFLRMDNNQILIQLAGETETYEICSVEDIQTMEKRINEVPTCRARKRRLLSLLKKTKKEVEKEFS